MHNASDFGYKPVIYLCSCGSGLERYALVDAAHIFCAYVCPKCVEKVRSRYNPSIFNDYSQYAVTGEEEDIGVTMGSNNE